MGGWTAIDDLIRRASDAAASTESLHEAIGPALATFSPGDRLGAEAVLRRLAGEIVDAPTRPDLAGIVAVLCGALVERGLGPTLAIGPILDRIERQIAPEAIAFVAACQQAAEVEDDPSPPPNPGDGTRPAGNPDDPPDPVQRYGERIAALMPSEAQSFQSLESFSRAAVAMLSRSIEARKASQSRTALRAALDELGGQYGHAGWLWVMMQVLDDEPILVLHPGEGKGFRVRISGLAHNFQLHTLLADALIGRFPGRWLRGARPTRAEIEAARDGAVREGGPSAHGVFNLWTWRGLKPNGTLRDAMSNSAYWVWNEGVPADIPPFEGTRVVLLGPPPYPRSWTAGRAFPVMAGDLRVEHILTRDEVCDHLGRIAASAPAD
jgi:hypothetical protein